MTTIQYTHSLIGRQKSHENISVSRTRRRTNVVIDIGPGANDWRIADTADGIVRNVK